MNKKNICISIIIFYLISLILIMFDSNKWNYLIWHAGTIGIFPDTMQTIFEAEKLAPYESLSFAAYPTLTYLMLYPFSRLIGSNLYFDSSVTQHGFLALQIIWGVIILGYLYTINMSIKSDKLVRFTIFFCFIFSAPFIYGYERGNLVLLTVLFCTFFIFNYDSQKRVNREIALICLSIAFCMKLSPAILGLILINERRYKEAIKATIYAMVGFWTPFLFTGGISLGISRMIEGINLFSSAIEQDVNNFGYGFRISIKSWVYALCELKNISGEIAGRLTLIIMLIVFLLLLIDFMLLKEKWEKISSLLLIVVLIPQYSWIYNICYMFIVVLLFYQNINKKITVSYYEILVGFLLFFLFAPFPYCEILTSLHGMNKISLSTFINSAAAFTLVITLSLKAIQILCHHLRERFNVENKKIG